MSLRTIDVATYAAVQAAPTPRWADASMTTLTNAADHSKLWLLTAAALARTGRPGRRAALRGLLAVGVASATANLVGKRLTRRGRPHLAEYVRQGRLPRRRPTSGSFPSGHSASAAAFAVGAASELPVLAAPLGLAAAAVGYSRVHTGVHYPGDVLAGWAIGTGAALATRLWWPLAPVDPATVRERIPTRPDHVGPGGKGVTVVVNASAEPDADAVRKALPEANVVALGEDDDLRKVLRAKGSRAAALGVCGGDGSVNAAAEVAYDTGRPLLVVPGGTLNHLARDLGLGSVEDAVGAVEDGTTAEIDVAEIDGRPFLNTASFGSYAALVDARERHEDDLGKWPALGLALWHVLRHEQPVEVEIDGVRRRVWAIFVGNCRYEPGGLAPAYRPSLRDGLLDVRVLHAGRRVWDRWFAQEVHVRADEPLRLARDGETFDGSAEFVIRKRPERLRVYTP